MNIIPKRKMVFIILTLEEDGELDGSDNFEFDDEDELDEDSEESEDGDVGKKNKKKKT
jgi:hypothetical protein